jgi:16S rRNA processing protein RimM
MLPFLESAALSEDAIEVGRILDAWGIKGWFRVQAYSAQPEALFSSKRWFIQPSERGAKHFEGTHILRIQEAKIHSDHVVARAHDCLDRNAAELLKGARVYVARSSFPTPLEDEFYWVDLVGLEVINRQGESLGLVVDILSSGPQSVLVIEPQAAQEVARQDSPVSVVGATQGLPVSPAAGANTTSPKADASRMIPFVSQYIDDVRLAEKKILVDWLPDY